MTEPNVPLTYVACVGCGSLTDIHAPTCPECQQPRPQQVAPPVALRCIRCGDEEYGPWAETDDGPVCEGCIAA